MSLPGVRFGKSRRGRETKREEAVLVSLLQVYVFSKGRINVANKRFSTLDNNYEITFNADADIRPVEDDGNIQAQKRLDLT